mgnify:CR=1 FL=1
MEKYKIGEENVNYRIDKIIPILNENITRVATQKLLEEGKILVNDKKVKVSYKVKLNDIVSVEIPEVKETELIPENIDIDVLYEDEYIIVVNKAKGMVVHPANGNNEGTLVNGLLYEMDLNDTINDVKRPGIVHRIDKDTSGLLMIAKNDLALKSLSSQLKEHSCNRIYVALVYGEIAENKGRIEAPIGRDPQDRKKMAIVAGGKEAVTNFKVLERFKGFTLIECKLETGRTHQIRVHMKYIGHPLVGDKVYGPKRIIGDTGQFLHAKTIGFKHPRTGKYMEFSHELPSYFIDKLTELRQK